MLDHKTSSTPEKPNAKLCSYKGKYLEDITMYHQLVESLIYLMLTRSDISFGIGIASRFISNPKKPHLGAVR